ncbi:hypothetical protein EDE15_0893 [Edaphobacter aggregans]|jgi:hypothetical protein|uniref:LTXXQ motif family protein n=1 Tax=Edaphobacter aggregans TaxID=570835 RepID=A0A3R9R159_9BACT|nr:hypothetical protein [Edaphobacter aggregans]RSL15407.1 hypothetical protein EDE15_0893 [Edaphobacter aggregans]
MKTIKGTLLVCVVALPFLATQSTFAKDPKTTSDKELNLQAYEKLLRMDVNAKREMLVKEIMHLSDADSQTFWPIYKDYEAERAKLDDAEAQLMSDYAKDYPSISDDAADQVMSKSLELETQRAELRKKYYDTMKKALSAEIATKFFEVDSQLQHIYDLQVASKLPANQS